MNSHIKALVYPHQLFEHHPALAATKQFVLVEDPLFFQQYSFHKQKILLHRASMKAFAQQLRTRGVEIEYIDAKELSTSGEIAQHLKRQGIREVVFCDPNDDWLLQRATASFEAADIVFRVLDGPDFLTPLTWAEEFFLEQSGKLRMASFYAAQRQRLGVLIQNGKPAGGKWSFDTENRKRLPKAVEVPSPFSVTPTREVEEAITYVNEKFPDNPGSITAFCYPTTHRQASRALDLFLTERFEKYGSYQDAIDQQDSFLFHSVLSPALNIGLLTPEDIVRRALDVYADGKVPLNSVEGFIRQIIGWREYVRVVYHMRGRKQRSTNYFGFTGQIPSSFWSGTTGIPPVDDVIQRIQKTAYAHHIERLMVLSNFMLLCEFDPDQIYEWFMSLFIDAYDWVMVPNVYGMSLYADGGLVTTKPYVSSSNYIRKMSWYRKGNWSDIWDGLYWRFISQQRDRFEGNHRMGMILRLLEKMKQETLTKHRNNAEAFLEQMA